MVHSLLFTIFGMRCLQGFASGSTVPAVCNDLATVFGTSSVIKRNQKIFR